MDRKEQYLAAKKEIHKIIDELGVVLDQTYSFLIESAEGNQEKLAELHCNPDYDRLSSTRMWAFYNPRIKLMSQIAQQLEPGCTEEQWEKCMLTAYEFRKAIGVQLEEASGQFALMKITKQMHDGTLQPVEGDEWKNKVEPTDEDEGDEWNLKGHPDANPFTYDDDDPFKTAKDRMKGDDPSVN